MSAKLSRHVAKLMDMPVMQKLDFARRANMAAAVESANTLEDLPSDYQRIILEAERQMSGEQEVIIKPTDVSLKELKARFKGSDSTVGVLIKHKRYRRLSK